MEVPSSSTTLPKRSAEDIGGDEVKRSRVGDSTPMALGKIHAPGSGEAGRGPASGLMASQPLSPDVNVIPAKAVKGADVDIAEVYSMPRITTEAMKFGLSAGEAMDIRNGYDFKLASDRHRAIEYVREVKPLLIVGSPECRMFSTLQNLSPWTPKRQAEYQAAKLHINFCTKLYKMQLDEGRLFLHEHPAGASSWSLPSVAEMSRLNNVHTVIADQCMFGLVTKAKDGQGVASAKKATKFMTNSRLIADELSIKCDKSHTHQPLLQNRAKEAQVYPPGLCQAVCRGLLKEKKLRKGGAIPLMRIILTDKIMKALGSKDEFHDEKEETDIALEERLTRSQRSKLYKQVPATYINMPMKARFLDRSGILIEERTDTTRSHGMYKTMSVPWMHRWHEVDRIEYSVNGMCIRAIQFVEDGTHDACEGGDGSRIGSLAARPRSLGIDHNRCLRLSVLQHDGKHWVAYDDVTGLDLDANGVYEARLKEIEYVKSKQVWVKIPRSLAKSRGWKILKARWIDINKGDDANPVLRSRYVGKEFNTGPLEGLFAATPPLEALRALISEAATVDEEPNEKVIEIDDVSRAFFEAPAVRQVCVEIPEEALTAEDREQDMVGHLMMSLYGTRDAATNWQEEIAKFMTGCGFVRGMYNPCLYLNKAMNLKSLVHGDDFVTVGRRAEVSKFNKKMAARFDIKTSVIGPRVDYGEVKEAKVLNRIVRLTPEGYEYEADQRHADMIVEQLGLKGSRGVVSPGEATEVDTRTDKRGGDSVSVSSATGVGKGTPESLSHENTALFRSVAARANYLSQDRPDISYAVKEVCRHMAGPTELSLKALKRLGRYLITHSRFVFAYRWQCREYEVKVYTDSDWAGCKATGKSTSGGCVLRGQHFLKAWSKTQQNVTLSSAEAELVAMNKGAAELLGILSMYSDFGEEGRRPQFAEGGDGSVSVPPAGSLQGVVCGDSSAAIAVSHRQGCGKLRHIHIGQLWIQEKVRDKDLQIRKVPGTENPADLFTKHLGEAKRENCIGHLSLEQREGRADHGLRLQLGNNSQQHAVIGKLASLRTNFVNMHHFPRYLKRGFRCTAYKEEYEETPSCRHRSRVSFGFFKP